MTQMTRLSQPVTDLDHVSGSLDAEVVILEYGDYDCPHTRAANANLKHLLEERPGRLALVFRHFPLRHIHQNAEALARLMKAIKDPARYWQAHDSLMAIRRMSLPLAEEALQSLGFDVPQLRQDEPTAADLVQLDVDRGKADGVHSTPSFFFNGDPWDGHYDVETLRQRISLAPERSAR
jgi:protein-disulfide isomerase